MARHQPMAGLSCIPKQHRGLPTKHWTPSQFTATLDSISQFALRIAVNFAGEFKGQKEITAR